MFQVPSSSYRVTASMGLEFELPQGVDLSAMGEQERRAIAESLQSGMHRGMCESVRVSFQGSDPVSHCMQGGGGGAPTVSVDFQIDSRLWPSGTGAPIRRLVGMGRSWRRSLSGTTLSNSAEIALNFPDTDSAERATSDLRNQQGSSADLMKSAVMETLVQNEDKIGPSIAQFVDAVSNSIFCFHRSSVSSEL